MKRSLSWAASALTIFFALSCGKSDPPYVSGVNGSGMRQGKYILDDNGNRLQIVELTEEAGEKFFTSDLRRVFFTMDVLKRNSENDYDVRLTELITPLHKKALKGRTDSESAPLGLENAWISGGHLNLKTTVLLLRKSNTEHEFICLNTEPGRRDSLCLQVFHNARGEAPKDMEEMQQAYQRKYCFLSFDISEQMPPATDVIPVKVSFPSYYVVDGEVDYTRTSIEVLKGELKRQ